MLELAHRNIKPPVYKADTYRGQEEVSNGQLGMRTLSIKEGSRASIYTPDR